MTIKNKKAFRDYEILEELEAGIELQGSEVKSIAEGAASIGEAFVIIKKREAWLLKSYIAPYEKGTYSNHDPYRKRKLLLHKREIRKFEREREIKRLTIIPLKLYFNTKGKVKVLISLARGKKKYDKREDLKNKDAKKEIKKFKL